MDQVVVEVVLVISTGEACSGESGMTITSTDDEVIAGRGATEVTVETGAGPKTGPSK